MLKNLHEVSLHVAKVLRSQTRDQRYLTIALLVLGVGALGSLALGSSNADTFKVTSEAESGTIVGNAGPGSAADASGTGSVLFGAPDPGGDCTSTGYPGSACAGLPPSSTQTVNTPQGGFLTVTDANAVIDGQDIQGCVVVQAAGVTIKNSKITCGQTSGVVVDNATASVTIEDSEIICTGAALSGVNGTDVTARRVNVHGCRSGFLATGALTLEDSFIHDMPASGSGITSVSAGVSLVRTTTTAATVSIKHNTIHAKGATAAIGAPGNLPDTTITQNLLAGGIYTLQCPISAASTNFTVTDNHFSTKFYPTVGSSGPWQNCDDEATVSGNVYHETGLPL